MENSTKKIFETIFQCIFGLFEFPIKTWEKFRNDKYCKNYLFTYVQRWPGGLVAVCFSTLGGVHVFSLLHSYISDWPLLVVTVLTTLAGTHCMSMSKLIQLKYS